MRTTGFSAIHMSGVSPLGPADLDSKANPCLPSGFSFADGKNNSLVDAIDPTLPIDQVSFATLGDPSNTANHSTGAFASTKRNAEGDEEAEMNTKRHREDRFSMTAHSTDNLLGRSWGPNVLTEPSGSHTANLSFRAMLPGNQNMNDNLTSNLAGAPTDHNNAAGPNFFAMNNHALLQAGFSAQLLRDHVARNQAAAANAMLLAQFGGNNAAFGGNNAQFGGNNPQFDGTNFEMFGAISQHQQISPWGNQLQGQGAQLAAAQQQANQFAALQSFVQLDQLRQGNMGIAQPNSTLSSLMSAQGIPQPERQHDLSSLLRQLNATNNSQLTMNGPGGGIPNFGASSPRNATVPASPTPMRATLSMQHALSKQPHQRLLELPPCEEGHIDSHFGRAFFPLGIEEDPNWLSEFHCYVRSDLVEVFRASRDDAKARNNSIAYQQVGIRCRFCAHMPTSARAGRASAFPSSVRQIYQSFTMMLRDHFGNCEAMPAPTLEKFMLLKDKPAQGATDSKRYWIHSATKIGMADTSDGLVINEQTRADGAKLSPFGTASNQKWEDEAYTSETLVVPSDRPLVAEFLFVLMSQVQPIRLTEAECIGNRRSLRVGLPGFGCIYCCEHKRLGLCRMFPARRRTLPSKVNDLYDHLRRCNLCPKAVKDVIENARHQMRMGFHSDQGGDREFFDRVWARLGHSE